MVRSRGEIIVVCPTVDCGFFLKEMGKDVIKRGFNDAGHRQYLCFHCHKYFVETAGMPLFRRHIPKQELILICKLLVEKNVGHFIERITGHHRYTINLVVDKIKRGIYGKPRHQKIET